MHTANPLTPVTNSTAASAAVLLRRQNPYAVVRVGGQEFRTVAAKHGGRNPVWGESLRFNVNQENDVWVELKVEEAGSHESLGWASLSLSRAREHGTDRMEAPVLRHPHRGKGDTVQQGVVSVALKFEPNAPAYRPGAYAAPGYPAPYPHQQQQQQPYPQQPPPYPQPYPAYQQPPMYAPAYAPPPQQQVVYAAPPPPAQQVVYLPPPPPPSVVYVPPPAPMPTTVIIENDYGYHHRHHHHYHHHGGYDGGDVVLAGAVGFGLGLLF